MALSGRQSRMLRVLCKSDAPCAFMGYQCSLPRTEGYEYCIRHILEDKTSPFHQCSFVFPNSSRRCFRAAPISEKKEGYCTEHTRKAIRKRQQANYKKKLTESPETCLSQLSHHHVTPLSSPFHNAIPDPASVPSVAATALEYYDDDNEELDYLNNLDVRLLPRIEDDSELDSAESDADPLEHAGVFTTEEVARIYLEKLQKLKCLYMGEYKRLGHILRENRREYLHTLRAEKDTMMSIHAQPKDTLLEREAYQELKSLSSYHRHLGKEALLHKQYLEKRLQTLEGTSYKPGSSVGCVKCIYSEGSWRCGEKSVPLSKYCFKHILQDERQVLFRPCGSFQAGGEECEVPVIPLPHTPTCVYHTPIPKLLPVINPIQDDILTDSFQINLPNPRIIDLSDSSAFIVSELPPEHVMEGDAVEQPEEPSSNAKTVAVES